MFAYSHEDMPGIDPSVMVHRLNVSPSFPLIWQKKRVFAQERDRAIAEVGKLQEAGFIREVYYPDWLANVVMVRLSTHLAEEASIRPRARPSNSRSRQLTRGGLYQGSILSRLASECGDGQESQREMEDVCKLYGSEQSMPQG